MFSPFTQWNYVISNKGKLSAATQAPLAVLFTQTFEILVSEPWPSLMLKRPSSLPCLLPLGA